MKKATLRGRFFHITDACRYLIAIALDALAPGAAPHPPRPMRVPGPMQFMEAIPQYKMPGAATRCGSGNRGRNSQIRRNLRRPTLVPDRPAALRAPRKPVGRDRPGGIVAKARLRPWRPDQSAARLPAPGSACPLRFACMIRHHPSDLPTDDEAQHGEECLRVLMAKGHRAAAEEVIDDGVAADIAEIVQRHLRPLPVENSPRAPPAIAPGFCPPLAAAWPPPIRRVSVHAVRAPLIDRWKARTVTSSTIRVKRRAIAGARIGVRARRPCTIGQRTSVR